MKSYESMSAPAIAFAFACCLGTVTAKAQDTPESRPAPATAEAPAKPEETKAPAKDAPKPKVYVAIRGGDVHVGDGTVLRRATVVLEDGKIHAVGRDVTIPDGAETIDASGKFVSPGIVAVRGSGFGAPSGFGLDAIEDSLNPYDPSIKLGLACGITSFGMLTDEGRDTPGGKSAVIKLAPGDLEGMLCVKDTITSMRVPLTPKQWHDLRDLVGKAKEFLAKKDEKKPVEAPKPEAAEATPAAGPRGRRGGRGGRPTPTPGGAGAAGGKADDAPKPPRGTETIVEILQGKKQLWIDFGNATRGWFSRGPQGSDNDNVRQALDIAELLGKGVVLNQPVTAWTVPEAIAATGSMVILDPRSRLAPVPGEESDTGSNFASSAILAAAGVPIAITSPSPGLSLDGLYGQDLSTPTVDAAYAVRGGLDPRRALATLTLDAARALGVDARLGSIAVGKDADLLILNGDPLHYSTLVETAIVNGKVVYERQKEPFFSHIQR